MGEVHCGSDWLPRIWAALTVQKKRKERKEKKKEDLRDYIIMCSSGFYPPTGAEKDSGLDSFKVLRTN